MSTSLDENYWHKEFLEIKTYKPSDVRLLMKGAKGFKYAWHLGTLHMEYERMKKRQELQQSNERRHQLEARNSCK